MAESTSCKARPKPRRCGRVMQSRDKRTLLSRPQPRILSCVGEGKPRGPKQAGPGGGSQRTPPAPDRSEASQHPARSPPRPGWPQGTPGGDARSPTPAPAPSTRRSCSHQVPEHTQHRGRSTNMQPRCAARGTAAPRGGGGTARTCRTRPGRNWAKPGLNIPALRLLRCRLIHAQVCTRRCPRCCIAAPAPCCSHTATEVPRRWVAAYWWTSQWGDLGGVTPRVWETSPA